MTMFSLRAFALVLLPLTVVNAAPGDDLATTLAAAQQGFYNAQYEKAAVATRQVCFEHEAGMAACELRTAALLFQVKRALGSATNKSLALKQCAECPRWISEFDATFRQGLQLTRAHLLRTPNDDDARFLLGKLNLNFVWLHLGTLGRKTGWGEYWEARKTLDELLKRRPDHVRARVARGWIDYIVDTKLPRGTRWLLGGGNKKKGLQAVRDAASAEAEWFTRAEARFALWDMQVRERDLAAAVVTARALSSDFPENQELQEFMRKHANLTQ